jgi:DNA polymerase-1
MPLIAVLAAMERAGVKLDIPFLREMSQTMDREVERLRREILAACGEEFNLNSPQQLARVLFERLEIHKALGRGRPRRTKSGAYSTDATLLERYAEHPVIAKLFEYRQWIKLKSTYVDTLPALVNPKTGRLHTSYNQTVAITGRLSSSDPNLQNIPIRTEAGREIRRAFIAEPGHLLVAADYSQIELRILAHLSADPALIAAFAGGEDVHRRTAALMFKVDPAAVTREMRSRAKTINFGIVYGMNAYGLSARLGIPVEEAHSFIQAYFEVYPGVRAWIESTIERARQDGQVTTLLGRRRAVAELASPNPRVRQAAENTAVNTPVQGSAADMIKKAMVALQRELRRRRLRSRMILQVHDELVFEVAQDEVETVAQLARQEMQSALDLKVPVVVDVGVGPNWLEAH